jgi:hypothetical protein
MKKTTRQLALLYVSFAFCVIFHAASALAGDCVTDCMNSSCWSGGSVSNPTACHGELHRCEIACQNKNNKSFGAIAYSAKDKASGWSYGWDNQSKAERVALENCAKHGSQCKAIVWYDRSCGAVAADGNIVTWGQASAKQRAAQLALDNCTKAGGKKCAIQTSQCSRN